MDEQTESRRSRALDQWEFRDLFKPFHVAWGEGDITPAFEANHAYAIAVQELCLDQIIAVWGHREVLVTFSSEHIGFGNRPAEREPAWVVIIAGTRVVPGIVARDILKEIHRCL